MAGCCCYRYVSCIFYKHAHRLWHICYSHQNCSLNFLVTLKCLKLPPSAKFHGLSLQHFLVSSSLLWLLCTSAHAHQFTVRSGYFWSVWFYDFFARTDISAIFIDSLGSHRDLDTVCRPKYMDMGLIVPHIFPLCFNTPRLLGLQ